MSPPEGKAGIEQRRQARMTTTGPVSRLVNSVLIPWSCG